jgi:ABC-2 type transport system ATP-binding protein
MTPLPLVVSGASKSFGATPALADVSLTARPGEITAVVGGPGMGKSTVARAIMGLVRLDAGQVLIAGQPLSALPDAPRAVAAALGPQLLRGNRTGAQALHVHAARVRASAADADRALARVGLALPQLSAKISATPPAVVEQLCVALALLSSPRLLVLDDPFSRLPGPAAVQLLEALSTYASDGNAVLTTSAALGPLAEAAGEVVILGGGRVVWQGPAESLRGLAHTRLLVHASDPHGLAVALAALGEPSARIMRDGRLAVPWKSEALVLAAADAAGATVFSGVIDHVDAEQLYLQMAAPTFVPGASFAAPAGFGAPGQPFQRAW